MAAHARAFLEALDAGGPAADRAGNMHLYGWLVGSWELDVVGYPDHGPQRRRPGEWHFGWVLEGRAIQDVWIVPSRQARRPGEAVENGFYGTTLPGLRPADRCLAYPMDRSGLAGLFQHDRPQAG